MATFTRTRCSGPPADANLLRTFLLLLSVTLLPALPARAQLTIEIVGGAGTTIPISIVPFESEATLAARHHRHRRRRSRPLRASFVSSTMPAARRGRRGSEEVRVADWRARGADAVVVGSMRALRDGRVEVRFALVDAAKASVLASQVYTVAPAQFRATAHRIADVIYETLTGAPACSRRALPTSPSRARASRCMVADADGNDPQTIVSSNEPLLSPRWAPDGSRIAYVSLEQKKPVVYVQSLATGGRQAVANFRGSNSAPAWSPDGRRWPSR